MTFLRGWGIYYCVSYSCLIYVYEVWSLKNEGYFFIPFVLGLSCKKISFFTRNVFLSGVLVLGRMKDSHRKISCFLVMSLVFSVVVLCGGSPGAADKVLYGGGGGVCVSVA